MNELKPRNFEVVALQEMCWKGAKDWGDGALGFHIYQSGGADNKLGTGFIVLGKKMMDRVMDWKAISDRMCWLRIKGRFYNYTIFNVHCPHEGSPDAEKEAFYAKLEKEFDSRPQRDVKIVIGDMNARIGREEMYKPVIGPNSLHTVTNNNGQRCINFAASRGMVVRSTFFPRKNIHKVTWTSPNQRTKTQIDHVLIDGRFFSDIRNIRTYRGADINSDHYLVGVSMHSKLSTTYHQRRSQLPRPFNLERLQDATVAQNYVQQLEASLPTEEELGAASLNDGWSKIHSAISSAAEATLGSTVRVGKQRWFDEECQRLLDEKNAAHAMKLKDRSVENVARYNRALKQQRTVFKQKRRQLEDRDRAEMEQLFRQNETRKFYEKVNQTRKGYTPLANTCRDTEGNLLTNKREVLDRWQQHFNEHLNGDVAHGDDFEAQLGPPAADEQFPAPDLETVKREIRQLKNNRAAGKDRLPGELFKYGGEQLARAIHLVISKIWEEENLPDEWMDGVVCPIFKKGDKLDCRNYRGITLINAAYKILSQILCRLLTPYARRFVGRYQAGFTGARATTDQIFSLRQILEKCREYNVPTHHIFIDFKAAYDTVDREQLWQIMHENGFPDKLTRLIKATLDRVMCHVRVAGELADPFRSQQGLRQGDGLSNALFNIGLEGVVRRAGIDTEGTICNKSVQLLAYADDIDIIARDQEEVKRTYTDLKKQAKQIGLAMNTTKTKYMRGRGSKDVGPPILTPLAVDGDELEEVDEFVYLGSLETADNDTSKEILTRIHTANRAYFGLRKTLTSGRVQRATKLTLYKTLIRPVALYGHEAWTLRQEDERALGVFERKVLRTIYGGVQTAQNEWRRRTNHELHALLGEPTIVNLAKIGRLRWAGHVARMDEDHPVRMLFDRTRPDGGTGRRAGAPRARWGKQIQADLRKICNLGDWRAAAQNRGTWRNLLDTARTSRMMF